MGKLIIMDIICWLLVIFGFIIILGAYIFNLIRDTQNLAQNNMDKCQDYYRRMYVVGGALFIIGIILAIMIFLCRR